MDKPKIEQLLKIVSLTLAVLYAMGYLIWYWYLSLLGFGTPNLLESRYILTGLLLMMNTLFYTLLLLAFIFFVIGPIYLILKKIYEKYGWVLNRPVKDLKSTSVLRGLIGGFKYAFRDKYICYLSKALLAAVVTALIVVVVGFVVLRFAIMEFSSVSQKYGGAQPQIVSMVVGPEFLQTLNHMGVRSGDNSTSQTQNLCMLYEDDENLVFLTNEEYEGDKITKGRILNLSKDNIIGTGSIASKYAGSYKKDCSDFIKGFLYTSFLST